MMAPGDILVIPDIHDRIDQLRKIDTQFGTHQPRIYLGDWTDSFNQRPHDRDQTVSYLAKEMGRPDRTLLWGNHDWHYSSQRTFVCSGYQPSTKDAITSLLPENWESYFQFTHEAHGWLLSHAGFNVNPANWTPDDMANAVGYCRGGSHHEGGPLWLDWNREFRGLTPGTPEYRPQIVGHTTHDGPCIKGANVCLDTKLTQVGVLKPSGELHIHTITGKKKGLH